MKTPTQSTPSTILGTLVDRAVSMPFSLPQVLRHGCRRQCDENGTWSTDRSITDDVSDAAEILATALSSTDAPAPTSAAALIVDPAGPWWPRTRDNFFSLSSDDRMWVFDRFRPAAATAAKLLERRAIDERWTWMWSQPAFPKPGKLRPSLTRPDLVAGLDWKKCIVIDLKTTSELELGASLDHRKLHSSFSSWTESLTRSSFAPVSCEVLLVSTEDDCGRWITIDPSDQKTEA